MEGGLQKGSNVTGNRIKVRTSSKREFTMSVLCSKLHSVVVEIYSNIKNDFLIYIIMNAKIYTTKPMCVSKKKLSYMTEQSET